MLPELRDRSQPLLPAKAAPGKASGTACVLLSSPDALRTRGWRILLALLTVNAFVMALLLVLTKSYPSLMSSGLLAFSFGLRHSVDADHIAAISSAYARSIGALLKARQAFNPEQTLAVFLDVCSLDPRNPAIYEQGMGAIAAHSEGLANHATTIRVAVSTLSTHAGSLSCTDCTGPAPARLFRSLSRYGSTARRPASRG